MVFCEFVVCLYLIVGESFQLQYTLIFRDRCPLILDLRRFLIKWVWFQQNWVWSIKHVGPPLLPKLFPPLPQEKNPV